jgi:hypothetical protein
MLEILADEKLVLACLLHPETPQTVSEETKLSAFIVRDIIRTLHHHRYIKATNSPLKNLSMFDADAFLNTKFQLTAKGIQALQTP